MTRAVSALALIAAFAALLFIADRTIAGMVQCEAAQTCPEERP